MLLQEDPQNPEVKRRRTKMSDYTKLATSDTPAHIVYVLDASGTMGTRTVLDGRTRAEWLSDALENVLDGMIERSYTDEIYHPRYKIAVITYSNKVDATLTNNGFIDVKQFWDAGIPQFKPGGDTNTHEALKKAYEILENLLGDSNVKRNCPAPLVCHVTDGEYNTGGNPTPIAERIKKLRCDDGSVLFQNLFITDGLLETPIKDKDVKSWAGFTSTNAEQYFKGDRKDYAVTLFNMSSTLPRSYASVVQDNGFGLDVGARMMFPGTSFELIKLALVTAGSTPFKDQTSELG